LSGFSVIFTDGVALEGWMRMSMGWGGRSMVAEQWYQFYIIIIASGGFVQVGRGKRWRKGVGG
jgi:hypothetical protein